MEELKYYIQTKIQNIMDWIGCMRNKHVMSKFDNDKMVCRCGKVCFDPKTRNITNDKGEYLHKISDTEYYGLDWMYEK